MDYIINYLIWQPFTEFNNGFIIIFSYRHIELNKEIWITFPISFENHIGSGYTVNGKCTTDFITVQKTQIGFKFIGTDNGKYYMGYIVCGF